MIRVHGGVEYRLSASKSVSRRSKIVQPHVRCTSEIENSNLSDLLVILFLVITFWSTIARSCVEGVGCLGVVIVHYDTLLS